MANKKYTLSHVAYVKIFLHAAKHPHKPVNGVLVGKVSSGTVEIVDTIPLLHNWTSLSPMMEIGLDLARRHTKSLGLCLAGYYQASAVRNDRTLGPVGERILQEICKEFDEAIAFVIDGETLGSGEAGLIPCLRSSTSARSFDPPAFTPGSSVVLVNPESPMRARELVVNDRLHEKFGDFDDHLEDVTIDWLRNGLCHNF